MRRSHGRKVTPIQPIMVILVTLVLAAAALSQLVTEAEGAQGFPAALEVPSAKPSCARIVIGRRGASTNAPAGPPFASIVGRCRPSAGHGADALGTSLDEQLDLLGALGLVAGVRQRRGPHAIATTGHSDIDLERPLEADDRFPIASITKSFTAIVILQLAEEGRVALDDPIDAYLPDLTDGGSVTLRHLLSHTSGIPNFLGDPAVLARIDQEWDHDDLVAAQVARGLLFEPGSRYSYSNTNFIALGRIVERITGATYAAELARRILQPLHLRNTSVADGFTHADGIVSGARLGDGSLVEMSVAVHPSLAWSAGGMISSADDLLRWIEALFEGRLLRRSSLEAMTAGTTLSDGTHSSYGLGIAMIDSPLGRAYYHEGNLAPYTSLIGYVPEARFGVVVLSSTLEAGALSVYGALVPTLTEVATR